MELWAARLERELTPEETAALLELLPPARQERLLRLRQPQKRREPLCAYLMLRRALRERLGWRELPPMACTSLGKPYFPGHPDVHFNLSHTDGAVLAGLSDRPLGVDIEKIRPVGQAAMRRLADTGSEEAFFQSWVRREALAKCSGAGVGAALSRGALAGPEERFWPLEIFPGYAAGAAARSPDPPLPVRKYFLEQLL